MAATLFIKFPTFPSHQPTQSCSSKNQEPDDELAKMTTNKRRQGMLRKLHSGETEMAEEVNACCCHSSSSRYAINRSTRCRSTKTKTVTAVSCGCKAAIVVAAAAAAAAAAVLLLIQVSDALHLNPMTTTTRLLVNKNLQRHDVHGPLPLQPRKPRISSTRGLCAGRRSFAASTTSVGRGRGFVVPLNAVPTDTSGEETEKAADDRPIVSTEERDKAESMKLVDAPTISTSNRTTTSSGGGEGDEGVLPSYKSLFIFTATTILIWLSEPLLSLVDTTIVGLTMQSSKAVLQIAALGPATTLYDSAIYMTYFLAISMTNQLAPKLAAKDWKGSRRSTSHLMGLAALFGGIVTLVTFGIGRQLISQMVGTAMDPTIIPLATNYAKIRAIVSPFAVVGFVAQSFCLTILDTKTPAIAVAIASIVNVIGDLALSPRFGIQGAAVATALATVASCLVLVNKVWETVGDWKKKEEEEDARDSKLLDSTIDSTLNSEPEVETAVIGSVISSVSTDNSTALGAVRESQPETNDIPFWSLPERKATIKLLKVAGPIFFTMMAKVLCYSIMTVRASNFGVIPLASHNIMTRVFFFFACFGDSLSQAAQSFYPQVVKKSRGKLIKRLFLLSAVVGVNNYLSSNLVLQRLGHFLSKDTSIIKMMSQYAPFVGYSVFLHPFIMVLEGTVLAKRDFNFMIGMYIATTLLHFGCVFSPFANTFEGLWQCLFGFQFLRLIQFGYRVWNQSRKENDSKKQTI